MISVNDMLNDFNLLCFYVIDSLLIELNYETVENNNPQCVSVIVAELLISAALRTTLF